MFLTVFFFNITWKNIIFVTRRFSDHQTVLVRRGMSRWGTSYVGFFQESLIAYSHSTELCLNQENKLYLAKATNAANSLTKM